MCIIIKKNSLLFYLQHEYQTGRSDKNPREEALKERIKENNIGQIAVAHI